MSSDSTILEQRRGNQLVAVTQKFVEQLPAQMLDLRGLGRQQVFNGFRAATSVMHVQLKSVSSTRPMSIEVRPMKAQLAIGQLGDAAKGLTPDRGATKGNSPSITSISAKASNRVDMNIPVAYLPLPLVPFLRYLKKSELGSTTSRSLLLLKLWR